VNFHELYDEPIHDALPVVPFTFRNERFQCFTDFLLTEFRSSTQSSERRATRICRNMQVTLAIAIATSKKSSTVTFAAKRVDHLIVLAIRLENR
jgi:hypothetical protein